MGEVNSHEIRGEEEADLVMGDIQNSSRPSVQVTPDVYPSVLEGRYNSVTKLVF